MAETVKGSYEEPPGVHLPVPEFINEPGRTEMWGINVDGEPYAWAVNDGPENGIDFATEEGRKRIAEIAAEIATGAGIRCRIGAPIDRKETNDDDPSERIHLDPRPNQCGFYLYDPGDYSSHSRLMSAFHAPLPDRYTPEQRAVYDDAFSQAMSQLTSLMYEG